MNTNFYKGGWENNMQYTENSTAQHSVPSHQKDCKHKWTESKYNKNSSSNNNSFYILLLSLCVFYYTAIVA